MKKNLLLTSVASGALVIAGAAFGADMPVKAQPAYTPAFSWSGCYVGAHTGWGWSNISGQGHTTSSGSLTSYGSFDNNKLSGGIFGGQLGCNYQVTNNFVIGIEGSLAGTDINGFGPDHYATSGRDTHKIDSLGSVTGRIGWNGWDPQVLFYAKGGWAWAHAAHHIQPSYSEGYFANQSRFGWVLGGGAEWALSFAPKWTVFVEYNHYDFGKKDLTFTSGYATNINQKIDTVKIGVNYKLLSHF